MCVHVISEKVVDRIATMVDVIAILVMDVIVLSDGRGHDLFSTHVNNTDDMYMNYMLICLF